MDQIGGLERVGRGVYGMHMGIPWNCFAFISVRTATVSSVMIESWKQA